MIIKDRRAKGEYVYKLVNEGAGMCGLRIGVVAKAGPRTFEVVWESGQRNRYVQGYVLKTEDWRDYTTEEQARIEHRIAERWRL